MKVSLLPLLLLAMLPAIMVPNAAALPCPVPGTNPAKSHCQGPSPPSNPGGSSASRAPTPRGHSAIGFPLCTHFYLHLRKNVTYPGYYFDANRTYHSFTFSINDAPIHLGDPFIDGHTLILPKQDSTGSIVLEVVTLCGRWS